MTTPNYARITLQAKQFGVGIVVARNSNHYGIAGFYAEEVARNHGAFFFFAFPLQFVCFTLQQECIHYPHLPQFNTGAGLIGMSMTNTSAIAAPTGSYVRMIWCSLDSNHECGTSTLLFRFDCGYFGVHFQVAALGTNPIAFSAPCLGTTPCVHATTKREVFTDIFSNDGLLSLGAL